MFFKEYILKNFAKSTGKQLCQILFYNKVAKLRPTTTTLWKKKLRHGFLSENLENFFVNLFFYRTPPMVTSMMNQSTFCIFSFEFCAGFPFIVQYILRNIPLLFYHCSLVWEKKGCTRGVFRTQANIYSAALLRNSWRLLVVNYILKKLHRRCSTGFLIRLYLPYVSFASFHINLIFFWTHLNDTHREKGS